MSTAGDIARLCNHAKRAALQLTCAEMGLPAPSVIPAVNAAQRDLIAACRAVTEAVDALPAGEMPREWRQPRERKAS
jgi:hypothetical protein